MRNAIDARNVSNDPHNRYYASAEFVDKVTDAYLINGAVVHFGMASVEESPQKTSMKAVDLMKRAREAMWLKLSQISWKSMLFTVYLSRATPLPKAMILSVEYARKPTKGQLP